MNKNPTKRNHSQSNAKSQNQLNIQNNIFMGNEIDTIGRLPEPLVHRAMNLLEKAIEHKMKWIKKSLS